MRRHPADLNAAKGDAPGVIGSAVARAVGWARAQAMKQAHLADRLAEIGMEIAERLSARITPHGLKDARPAGLFRLAKVFEKVARAVLIARLLQARLAAELCKSDSEWAADLGRAQTCAETPSRQAMGDAPVVAPAHLPALDEGRAEDAAAGPFGLHAGRRCGEDGDRGMLGRLRRYVQSRPVEALIDRIRRDLGVSPDWLARLKQEWDRWRIARAMTRSPRKVMAVRERLARSSAFRALCPGPLASDLPWAPARVLLPP